MTPPYPHHSLLLNGVHMCVECCGGLTNLLQSSTTLLSTSPVGASSGHFQRALVPPPPQTGILGFCPRPGKTHPVALQNKRIRFCLGTKPASLVHQPLQQSIFGGCVWCPKPASRYPSTMSPSHVAQHFRVQSSGMHCLCSPQLKGQ